ncbi:hypothetical protein AWW66_03500 [Micromonospora rosaria]|uniref:Uncharacterized protein n=1 Tax=Micromonospora rosaria TaxID=47874 RepID=A0A136PY78_9ACTN|nr:hypothetical protein [Micromonospora rosaria]KXK63392.1 hypothetical protein AWW66_03500 [Micromonospora rosaria]
MPATITELGAALRALRPPAARTEPTPDPAPALTAVTSELPTVAATAPTEVAPAWVDALDAPLASLGTLAEPGIADALAAELAEAVTE